MNPIVLSIPAGGTYDIITEHNIHAYPHPRSYKSDSYVTFRKRGGAMETLYTIQKAAAFDPFNDTIDPLIKHLDQNEKLRIKAYIYDRNKGWGFEKPAHPYMFWILKTEKHLTHKPKPPITYGGHIYFTFADLTTGNEIVEILRQ
ncbi:hypothetical protein [Bacillus sp. FJAT-27445]|uniref:hypothetical protein n=1 Tax=Bacillus sp. FJAT-27445 TaxID=1679166 RepID=UPI000ABCD6FB|nr:hypothetical protein [Bacillus sp. FJAT-27445]